MKISFIIPDSRASSILNGFRFALAAMVVAFHGGIEVVPGYNAVMVFFVLSGYFISSSVFKLITENRWSWRAYLTSRVTRLWVVLIPALFLTLFWSELRILLLGDTSAFGNVLDWKTLVGNLFFLQGLKVQEYGLNTPLWSLTYEFWYYILFPCIVQIFYAPKKFTKVVYILIVIGLTLFLGESIMKYFLVWIFGAAIVFINPRSIKSYSIRILSIASPAILAAIAINLTYIFYRTNHSVNTPVQYLIHIAIGLSFSCLFYMIVSLYSDIRLQSKNIMFRSFNYLSGFSYTLYLTHYPLLLFIREVLYSELGVNKEAFVFKVAISPAIFLIIFAYAWLVSIVTEAHTGKVRKFISNMRPFYWYYRFMRFLHKRNGNWQNRKFEYYHHQMKYHKERM